MGTEQVQTKTGINPSVLGRERNRYNEMRQIEGVKESDITKQMKLDAKRYAKKLDKPITFEDYKHDIEALPQRRTGTGKREADKAERDTLILETQAVNAGNNLAILSHRGKVELSTEQKAEAFDRIGESADVLASHMVKAFDNVGAMTMLHAPEGLLCVHIAGWEDGSKNLRFQYAPRKLPISKRSGYRDDSFNAPVLETAPVTAEK